MTHMTEMDRNVTLADQLQDTGGPVILINKFEVAPADAEQFLAAWAADGAFFKKQPGFISAQLHRGIAGRRLERGRLEREIDNGVVHAAMPSSSKRGWKSSRSWS